MNPWNIKLETNNFSLDEKCAFLKIYKRISALNNSERKTNLILNPPCEELVKRIRFVYSNGYGLKLIARELNVSYTEIRTYFRYFGIEIRKGQNISTVVTKKFRRERVLGDKNPWKDWTNTHPEMIKTNSKGCQGYYVTKSNEKIWIRSSWEYVYIKWLDKNNIKYLYEANNYKLSNGESYRPDITILNPDGSIQKIIEIKGYYKNRLYKVDMFRLEYPNILIEVVDDILPYSELKNMGKELELWKKLRLKK